MSFFLSEEVEASPQEEINLVERAQAAGLYGSSPRRQLTSECQELLNQVYVPTWRTLKSKLRADGLAHKLGQLKLPAMHYSEDHWDLIHGSEDVRDDLALSMIEKAAKRFLRNVVEHEKWQPRYSQSGSRLQTYFVNACVLAYPEVFRAWARQRRTLETDLYQAWSPPTDPTTIDPMAWEGVRRLVEKAPVSTRPILVMLAFGFTQTEIAEHLGITGVR